MWSYVESAKFVISICKKYDYFLQQWCLEGILENNYLLKQWTFKQWVFWALQHCNILIWSCFLFTKSVGLKFTISWIVQSGHVFLINNENFVYLLFKSRLGEIKSEKTWSGQWWILFANKFQTGSTVFLEFNQSDM